MRVTLDRNVFEKMLLDQAPAKWHSEAVLEKLRSGSVSGSICASHFVWEHLPKTDRAAVFSALEFSAETASSTVSEHGVFSETIQIAPVADTIKPLPPSQANLIESCKNAGFEFLFHLRLGIPHPPELADVSANRLEETFNEALERMDKQSEVMQVLNRLGAGDAKVDQFYKWLEHKSSSKFHGGSPMRVIELLNADQKLEFSAALAERCDAEIVACHVGYGNDLLVTEDFAKGRNGFTFGPDGRAAATGSFGVEFCTAAELALRLL